MSDLTGTSSSISVTSFFENLKNRENNQNDLHSQYSDPNIIKLIPGTYKFRLLWLPSIESSRNYYAIEQYIHNIWDNDLPGNKRVEVICKSSPSFHGASLSNGGFRECPICTKSSELFKLKTKSKSADELYKKIKRVFRGYVPVYVVTSPNKEEIGKVKILQYSISFKKFFDEKILGVTNISESNSGDALGSSAFIFYEVKTEQINTTGYDFIVNVGKKKIPSYNNSNVLAEVNSYSFEFARKETTINDINGNNIDFNYLCKLNNMLEFDKRYYKEYSKNDIDEFYKKYLSDSNVVNEDTKDEDDTPPFSLDINDKDDKVEDDVFTSENDKTLTTDKSKENDADDSNDVDIDSILDELNF